MHMYLCTYVAIHANKCLWTFGYVDSWAGTCFVDSETTVSHTRSSLTTHTESNWKWNLNESLVQEEHKNLESCFLT